MYEKGQNSRVWWYKGQRENHSFVRGPFTWEEILHRLENGVVSDSTMVKKSVDVYWRELSEYLKPEKRSSGPMIAGMLCLAVALLFLFYFFANKKPDWSAIGRYDTKNVADSRKLPRESNGQDIPAYDSSSRQQTLSRSDAKQFNPQEPLTKDAIIKLGNDTRASHGFVPFVESQLLNRIAEERLRDMFQKQYIGHVSPTGEQASDCAQRVGYHYKMLAENIASGIFLNNQKIIDGWMQSPGHRQNILSPDTKEIGVAIDRGQYQGTNTWIAVQIFGLQSPPVSPRKHCTPPPQDLYAEIESKKAEMIGLDNRLARFKQELDLEINAIEADRGYVGNNGQAAYNLNIRISSYNEKSAWYNNSLADLMARRAILKAMAEDYNRRVQVYHDCENSNN
jgi:uncharacterized protein YkwD